MVTEVVNLWSGEKREMGYPPQESVIAAHAQEHGDYDTQGYMEKYGKLVVVATVTVVCGNWCAFTNASESPEQRLAKVKAAAARLGERGTITGGTEND